MSTKHAAIDLELDRLRGPTNVEIRLEVLRRLVEYWHGPIRPEDGLPEAELGSTPMPHPLRWWYRWAGRRKEILSGQNILLTPKDELYKYRELHDEDGYLLFYLENQSVYLWATLPAGDDPPVFSKYDEVNAPWEPEAITLSEHLILAAIHEAVMCHAPYGAKVAWLDRSVLSSIEQVIPPIAINPWRWLETRFYARNGAFMCAALNDADMYSVWIGSKTAEPVQFLKPYINNAWEYSSL